MQLLKGPRIFTEQVCPGNCQAEVVTVKTSLARVRILPCPAHLGAQTSPGEPGAVFGVEKSYFPFRGRKTAGLRKFVTLLFQ